MRLGILYSYTPRHHKLHIAIPMAKLQFNLASHTQGHQSAEIHFNPAQRPPDLEEIAGLRVRSDKRVPLNHIRITTKPLDVEEEFHAEAAEFGRQVEAAVAP